LLPFFTKPVWRCLPCCWLWLACSAAAHVHAQRAPTPWLPRHRAVSLPPRSSAQQTPPAALALTTHELLRLGLWPDTRALADLSRWPSEPGNPPVVDPTRLAEALDTLCGPGEMTARTLALAQQILRAAEEFAVDPFLLGALAYHQSGCRAAARNAWGAGLTLIDRGLLPRGLEYGSLNYRVPELQSVARPFTPPLPLSRSALLDPATNLYTAAALLSMWRDLCPHIDGVFQSAPHRHFVSHFIWGDRVRSAVGEDGILIARRRLLAYYDHEGQAQQTVLLKGVPFGSPLDGAPRIMISGLGDPRDNGKRAHAGGDLDARWGEPVRAVADGIVTRAGCDISDGTLLDLAPERAALVRPREFGARGLFVEITHENGYRSIYAHLASYTVHRGAPITRGTLIGYVGLTGVHESAPHLHFGLFDGANVLDPRRELARFLFAPEIELRELAGLGRH